VLTSLPPSCASYPEIWEPQSPGTLRACPSLYRDCFTFLYVEKHCGLVLFVGTSVVYSAKPADLMGLHIFLVFKGSNLIQAACFHLLCLDIPYQFLPWDLFIYLFIYL
jgi:hypothetical protein